MSHEPVPGAGSYDAAHASHELAYDAAYDVVVLGAGIVGVSAAYRLASEGVRVAVIDSQSPGRATAAGAGIISPVGLSGEETSAAWTALVGSAIEYYQELVARLTEDGGAAAGFAHVGQFVVATREDDLPDLAKFAARVEQLRAEGRPTGDVHQVRDSELRREWPELRGDMAGVYISNVARVDGRRVRAALEVAARKRGTVFINGHASLRRQSAADVELRVEGHAVRAGKVIVAAGAWAQPMLEELGVALHVSPVRGQIVHLDLPGADTARRPVINTYEGNYLLGFPDQRVVSGATHEAAGFDHRVTAGGVHEVMEKTLRIAPGLAGAGLVEIRVGFRPYSSDGYPIVGSSSSAPQVVFATGMGAWGLTLGPLLGEVAAELALEVSTSYDAAFLSPEREPMTTSFT